MTSISQWLYKKHASFNEPPRESFWSTRPSQKDFWWSPKMYAAQASAFATSPSITRKIDHLFGQGPSPYKASRPEWHSLLAPLQFAFRVSSQFVAGLVGLAIKVFVFGVASIWSQVTFGAGLSRIDICFDTKKLAASIQRDVKDELHPQKIDAQVNKQGVNKQFILDVVQRGFPVFTASAVPASAADLAALTIARQENPSLAVAEMTEAAGSDKNAKEAMALLHQGSLGMVITALVASKTGNVGRALSGASSHWRYMCQLHPASANTPACVQVDALSTHSWDDKYKASPLREPVHVVVKIPLGNEGRDTQVAIHTPAQEVLTLLDNLGL